MKNITDTAEAPSNSPVHQNATQGNLKSHSCTGNATVTLQHYNSWGALVIIVQKVHKHFSSVTHMEEIYMNAGYPGLLFACKPWPCHFLRANTPSGAAQQKLSDNNELHHTRNTLDNPVPDYLESIKRGKAPSAMWSLPEKNNL